MNIDVYAICWNEEKLLPYFLRHYSTFARSITIFDNYSDDGSIEIIKSCPIAQIKRYNSESKIRDDMYVQIKSRCWRGSDADYVIVVDIDELVWHADLVGYLEDNKHISIFYPVGYEMVGETFPTTSGQLYDEINHGVLFPGIHKTKPCMFDPQRITRINYGVGCHEAFPTGDVTESRDDDNLKLLHCKNLSADYVAERHELLRGRLSDINKARKWGSHYNRSVKYSLNGYHNLFQCRKLVIEDN